MAALQNQLLLWPSSDPRYLTFGAFLHGKLLSSSEKWRLRNLEIFAGFLDPNRSEVQWLGLRYPNVHFGSCPFIPSKFIDFQNQQPSNRNDFLFVVCVH